MFFFLLSISPISYGQDASVEDETQSFSYTLITEKLTSKVLSEERTVVVQLPKSYAENPDKNTLLFTVLMALLRSSC